MLATRACHSLVQWEGPGFPHCKVRERAGGRETSSNKLWHAVSPTWQHGERRKRSCRRKSRAARSWAEGRSGYGYTKSFIPWLFLGSQTALCISPGISKLLHMTRNREWDMSKIQSLNPHHSSSPSQCQLECTERSESLSEQRNMPFKPESSFQHCRIRNTVTIASYLKILLGTALT